MNHEKKKRIWLTRLQERYNSFLSQGIVKEIDLLFDLVTHMGMKVHSAIHFLDSESTYSYVDQKL